jgi:O-antigen biosynthesis protein
MVAYRKDLCRTVTSDYPHTFVSCVMPTKDRPQFLRQALRYFHRQTHPNAELIVVDDSEKSVRTLCAGIPRVRYIRLTKPTLLGTKMNIGIEAARGKVIQKLDDDDYYHPDFLRVALMHYPARNPWKELVAWDCFMVYLAGQKQARFSGHGWHAGGTLCFSREMWRQIPFRAIPKGVDHNFLIDQQAQVVRVCAPEHYMLVRHGRNTWTSMADGKTVEEFLRDGRKPYPAKLDDLLFRADCKFYRSLPALE